MNNKNGDCCPDFHPEKWDKKVFKWDKKPFIRETMPTFFHIPFSFLIGRKICKLWQHAEAWKKVDRSKDNILVLFHDSGMFKSEIFFSVTGHIPKANNVTISGEFIARVFEGEYYQVCDFINQTKNYLVTQEKVAKDIYVHYAYCPNCSKRHGQRYVLILAQI